MERSTQLTRSEGTAALDQQRVHTSEDGDRTMKVVLQNHPAVQRTAANTPEDVAVADGAEDSVVQKQARHGSDAGPCSAPDQVWWADDAARRSSTLAGTTSRSRISYPGIDRTTELGLKQNGFLIETEPGFRSPELANALADQDGALISSPNWWTEVETT